MPAAGGCNGWTPQAPLLLVYAYRYLFPARLQDHIGKSHPEYSPRMAQRHTTPDTPAIARHPESHWSPGTRGTALSRQSSVPDSRYGPRNGPLYRQYRLHASALAFSPRKNVSYRFHFDYERYTAGPKLSVPCYWLQILSSNGCHSLFLDSVIPGHSPAPIHHLWQAFLRQMVLRLFCMVPHIC